MKIATLEKISVRLYFNADCICLGGLALDAYSEKFGFNGDYYASEDFQIYPSQDVVGKVFSTIKEERTKIWFDQQRNK